MGRTLPILNRVRAVVASVAMLAVSCAPAAPQLSPSSPPTASHGELTTLAGQTTTLDQVRAGRPALVLMWATWCDACREEFQSVSRLAPKIAGDAELVLLSVGEEPATVHAFLKEHPLPGVVLLDSTFSYADGASQRRVPTTLVIDRHGVVAYRGGALDAEALATLRTVIAAR